MNREETKKLLPIIKAFSEGKTIQGFDCDNWFDVEDISEVFKHPNYDYRIKPEPKYRPFKDIEECWNEMLKHQPFGWLKDKDNYYHLIDDISNDEDYCPAIWGNYVNEHFDDAFEMFTFVDGSPFGVKED